MTDKKYIEEGKKQMAKGDKELKRNFFSFLPPPFRYPTHSRILCEDVL